MTQKDSDETSTPSLAKNRWLLGRCNWLLRVYDEELENINEMNAKNHRDEMTSHGVGALAFTIAHGCYVPTPMDAHWSNAKSKS